MTVKALVDRLVRLYRSGAVCPRCAAIIGAELVQR